MKSVRRLRFLALLMVVATMLVPVSPHAEAAVRRNLRELTENIRAQASADTPVFTLGNGRATVERAPRDVTAALTAAREALGKDVPLISLFGMAARLRAEAISGVRLPRPRQEGASAAEESFTFQQAFREVTPAGDLDGDGVHDLVTTDFVQRSGDEYEIVENRVAGVRGSDGLVLWEREMRDPWTQFAVPLGVDVTGDGRADLLRQTLAVDSAIPPKACPLYVAECVRSDGLEWNVEVLNGFDLSTAWSKKIAGSLTHARLDDIEHQNAVSAAVEVEVAGDQNADGSRDLIINVYDIDFDRLGSGFVDFAVEDSRIALRADVVNGRDGTVIFGRTRNSKRGNAAMRPAGNATGDAVPGLVLLDVSSTPAINQCGGRSCSSSRLSTASIEMIDGRTGVTAWTRKIERVGDHTFLIENAQADLNGDGASDVLVFSRATFLFVPTHLLMIDGTTGVQRWARSFDAEAEVGLQVVGPIGGAPGDDLAEVIIEYEESSDNFWVVVNRIDGASAAPLATGRHLLANTDESYSVGLATLGNLDGDATQDVIISIATRTEQDRAYIEESRVIVESGATAATLVDRTEPGWGTWTSGGDLNADGLDDLLNFVDYNEDPQAFRLSAFFSDQDGRAWSREEHYPVRDYGGYDFAVVPDVDGDGGSDIVSLRLLFGNHVLRRYDVVAGRTGATLWGHGDAINPTPGGYSSISGTVRNESGVPLQWICIEIYSASGAPLDFQDTRQDGTFMFGHLDSGPYKVLFNRCKNYGYESEWYNNKRSLASATEIHLENGLDLAGVDVVLSLPGIPINDDVIDAIPINEPIDHRPINYFPFRDSRDTSFATTEPGEPSCGGTNSIWYKIKPFNEVNPLLFVHAEAEFLPGIAVYKGDDPFTADMIACEYSTVSFLGDTNSNYWIQVGTWEGNGGPVTVEVADNPIF